MNRRATHPRHGTLLLAVVVALGLGLLSSCLFPWHMYFWHSTEAPLPDDYGRVLLQQRAVHPFLRESEFKARFELSNDMVIELPVGESFGERVRFAVKWYEACGSRGPWVSVGPACVDLGSGRPGAPNLLLRLLDGRRLGTFTDQVGPMRFRSTAADHRPTSSYDGP